MHRRFLRTGFGLAAIGVLAVAGTPVLLGQGPDAAGYTAPRTPWGDPDLQGIWEYWTFTPLQRPDEFGEREEITGEEAAEIAQEGVEAARGRDEASTAEGGSYGQEVWTERSRAVALTRSSLIFDPPDGKIPPVTSSEERRVAAHRAAGQRPVRTRAVGVGTDGPEDRGLAERCIVAFSSGPPMLPAGYNNNVQVFQAPGYVVLAVEMIHDVRVIPLDGREHLPRTMRQWLGDSRGRWEGDTLVVETTNFTDKIAGFSTTAGAWGTGRNLRLTERFTRVDDDTVSYEFTVDDPTVFTRSFSARFPMNKSELPLYEYACHEGNYGLHNILSGARAEERTMADRR